MTKPMAVTSSTHGKAVASYFLECFFGFLIVVGLVPAKALVHLFGEIGTHAWGLAMFSASAVTIYAAFRSPKAKDPTWAMLLEQRALLVSVVVYASFMVATLLYFTAPTIGGLFYVATLLGGSATRAWQIRNDLRRLKAAKQCPRTSDELTLAEPEETTNTK